jgi:hypothetical protein
MDASTSWLVPGERRQIGPGDYVEGSEGCSWAEPDMSSAVEALRHVREAGTEVANRRSSAVERMRSQYDRRAATEDFVSAAESAMGRDDARGHGPV